LGGGKVRFQLIISKFIRKLGTVKLVILVIIIFVVTLLIKLRFAGYVWLDFWGFEGKTVWDVLDLLIVPISLVLFTTFITRRDTVEINIQDYMDFIFEKIRDVDLTNNKVIQRIQPVLQIKTDLIFTKLHQSQYEQVLQFLSSMKLLGYDSNKSPVIFLPSLNLENVSVSNLYLLEQNMFYSSFNNCDFIDADFSKTNFTLATFQNCSLIKGNFSESFFQNTNFKNNRLALSLFYKSDLSEINFSWSDLTRAKFSKTCLIKVNFSHCVLYNTKFENSIFENVVFKNTKYNQNTIWPQGFNPKEERGLIFVKL
jgi:uncharacterized protein YjbI with pentapeptide repeats